MSARAHRVDMATYRKWLELGRRAAEDARYWGWAKMLRTRQRLYRLALRPPKKHGRRLTARERRAMWRKRMRARR